MFVEFYVLSLEASSAVPFLYAPFQSWNEIEFQIVNNEKFLFIHPNYSLFFFLFLFLFSQTSLLFNLVNQILNKYQC